MRIINLAEDTTGVAGCKFIHGLSFYVETKNHKLLVDTGPSEVMAENAKVLGVDISAVDTVIISHGHYDHADGMEEFLNINKRAKIYLQKTAFGEYYSQRESGLKYIGISKNIKSDKRIVLIDGNYRIDDEIFIFSGITGRKLFPKVNLSLKKRIENEFMNDDFLHEQCAVINCNGKKILMSGCAHSGIINILERYEEVCGGQPDNVISGFHLSRKGGLRRDDIEDVRKTAEIMKKYDTVFTTCHCTGEEAYTIMKEVLAEKLNYVHCGEEIEVGR